MNIVVVKDVGNFAENKDRARRLREGSIYPALRRGEEVVLDFAGVTGTTQSFVHALVSQAIRDPDVDALSHLVFENCNDVTRSVVEIVVSYSQDEWGSEDGDDAPI